MKNRMIESRAGLVMLLIAVIVSFWSSPARAVTYGTLSTSRSSVVYMPSPQNPVSMTSTPVPIMHMRSTSSIHMTTRRTVSSPFMKTLSGSSGSSASSGSSRPKGNIRRAKPTGEGSGGSTVEDGGETWYWDEDLEDWVNITPVGTIKEEDGVLYEWNGVAWVRKGEIADLGTPVGDTPWIAIILLCVLFISFRSKKRSPRASFFCLHSTLYTLHSTPYTVHCTPYTVHCTPYTLHPTLYTLHRTPEKAHFRALFLAYIKKKQ